jgi:hypothetical protein
VFEFFVVQLPSRTTTHEMTDCLSRLVPSSEEGGGGGARGWRNELRRWVRPRGKFYLKGFVFLSMFFTFRPFSAKKFPAIIKIKDAIESPFHFYMLRSALDSISG